MPKKIVDDLTDANLPDQKELEKEISDYLTRKYGDKIKIISAGLVQQEAGDSGDGKSGRHVGDILMNFDMKPEELADYLDEYVIRQQEAKAVLATKICTHFKRIRYLKEHPIENRRDIGRIKNNVLLIGPTGVGKTYLIKLIAQKIGVPFIKGDATKFSETGYVGGDVEDLVRDLVRQADGDIDRAQYGIIYVDEIDKIARSQNRLGADVSRSGVQRAFLKPMEETDVELKVPHDIISQMEAMEHFRATGKRENRTINTKNILFIMSGVFDGLEEIIRKRCQKQTMGFEGDLSSAKDSLSFLDKVMAEDLVELGFESEFVGRLPVVAVMNRLTEADFYQILTSPNCPIVLAKKQDFRVYGINLTFTDEAYREIARKAIPEKTGARGLVSVIEKVLLPFEKKLPSTSITSLSVTVEMVANPKREMAQLLNSATVQQEHEKMCGDNAVKEQQKLICFLTESKTVFLQSHGVTVTEVKLELMAQMCQQENIDISDTCLVLVDFVKHIRKWETRISEACGLTVSFEEAAVDLILTKTPRTHENIDTICEKILAALEYGLRLITHKKHISSVQVPVEGVEKPEQFINDLVEKTFKV